MDKNNDLYYNQIKGITTANKDNSLVITPNRFVLKDYLTRYKTKNLFSIEEEFDKNKSYLALEKKLDSAIDNNKSAIIFATSDLKNIDNNKYTLDFKNFINIYFSDTKFEINIVNEKKVDEYFLIKKRQNKI
jgi:hypothetical protein